MNTDERRLNPADFLAVMTLDGPQRRELYELWETDRDAALRAIYEVHYEIGKQLGREIERRRFVRERLEEKFGRLPAVVEVKLEALKFTELLDLNHTIEQAKSLIDLSLI